MAADYLLDHVRDDASDWLTLGHSHAHGADGRFLEHLEHLGSGLRFVETLSELPDREVDTCVEAPRVLAHREFYLRKERVTTEALHTCALDRASKPRSETRRAAVPGQNG